MNFISGFRIFDPIEREYHDIVLVIDGGVLKIFVYDNGWVEITPDFPEWSPDVGYEDIDTITVKWLGVDSRRKAVMCYSYGGDAFIPISIAKYDERKKFGITIEAGWYAERHQLIDKYEQIGELEFGVGSSVDVYWVRPVSWIYIFFSTASQTQILRNDGVSSVEVTGLTLSNTTNFSLIDEPTYPHLLAPGDELTIWVEVTSSGKSTDLTAHTSEGDITKVIKSAGN